MGKTMAEFMADLFLIVWWVGIPEAFLTWWFPVISTTLFSESLKCCRAVANWDVETTRRMIGSQHCETRCLCHHFFHLADCKLTCVFQVKDLWYNHSRQKRKLCLSLSLFKFPKQCGNTWGSYGSGKKPGWLDRGGGRVAHRFHRYFRGFVLACSFRLWIFVVFGWPRPAWTACL